MNIIVDNIENKKVLSSLGDSTPEKESKMIAYTINMSPKQEVIGRVTWGELSPDAQVGYLRMVHQRCYDELYHYLEEVEQYGSNQVCFEFTKSGEIHGHGYFVLLDAYSGYNKYLYSLKKLLRKFAIKTRPASSYMTLVKYATEPLKWQEYMHKEIKITGYTPFTAKKLQVKTMLDYMNVLIAETDKDN